MGKFEALKKVEKYNYTTFFLSRAYSSSLDCRRLALRPVEPHQQVAVSIQYVKSSLLKSTSNLFTLSRKLQQQHFSALRAARNVTGEASASRIASQFPSVPSEHIEHLLKLYNRRENLVISALLSQGHPRSTFILDEALFYKLKAKFTQVESDFIRQRLIRNENREHETIADILGSYALFNTARYDYPEKPVLKLKYLRFRYPTIDEIVLYDLLLNNDLDVRRVVQRLEEAHYSQAPVDQLEPTTMAKISETAVVRAALEKLNAPRPTTLPIASGRRTLSHHHNLEEQEISKCIC